MAPITAPSRHLKKQETFINQKSHHQAACAINKVKDIKGDTGIVFLDILETWLV
jgi:hypothetical protein